MCYLNLKVASVCTASTSVKLVLSFSIITRVVAITLFTKAKCESALSSISFVVSGCFTVVFLSSLMLTKHVLNANTACTDSIFTSSIFLKKIRAADSQRISVSQSFSKKGASGW